MKKKQFFFQNVLIFVTVLYLFLKIKQRDVNKNNCHDSLYQLPWLHVVHEKNERSVILKLIEIVVQYAYLLHTHIICVCSTRKHNRHTFSNMNVKIKYCPN